MNYVVKQIIGISLGICSMVPMWGKNPIREIAYQNPILPYDYSDPDVCRIGDTYVMTSSSFNNIPGLQILASKDLVHWQIVDAAVRDTLPGLKIGEKVLGNGIWAPSIREHKGQLYIYYGDPDRGIYCIRGKIKPSQTKNASYAISFPIEWEKAHLVMSGKGWIDPCPLWDDDGRCYLVHAMAGSRAGLKSCLLMAELTEDGLAVKNRSRIIFDGHEEHPTSEGPKLYKRNGYYYIMHPAGGVKQGWQVVQRSKYIYGPYESKIVLAQGKTTINGPHQGAWVETTNGDNWFFHFQDVGTAGRIVHLQPVRWINDWPEIGNHNEPVSQWGGVDNDSISWANFVHRDEFDQPTLGLDWQFCGGWIDSRWYYIDVPHSRLRLYSFPKNEELMPNCMLQKIPAVAFRATCRVRFCPNTNPKQKGKEEAGLIISGQKSFQLPITEPNQWVNLRVEMDRTQQGQFYTSIDGEHWKKVGDPFQATAGKWIGAQIGLYVTREDSSINDSGWLDVDWFETQML